MNPKDIESLKSRISADKILDKVQDMALNGPSEMDRPTAAATKIRLEACKTLLDKIIPTVKSQEIKDGLRDKFEDYLDLLDSDKKGDKE